MPRTVLAVIACLAMVGGSPLRAADRYVWLSGGNSDPYDSWTNAATNIQAAVDSAAPGETVWITNGTYGITNQIVVTNGITLRGFSGSPADTVVQRAAGQPGCCG